jgi:hypothetical protein
MSSISSLSSAPGVKVLGAQFQPLERPPSNQNSSGVKALTAALSLDTTAVSVVHVSHNSLNAIISGVLLNSGNSNSGTP